MKMANTFFSRMKGLLGKSSLGEKDGLLISPCSRVHTLGMKFPIDVVFMNRQGYVLKVVDSLCPGSQAGMKSSHFTLEIKAGKASEIGLVKGEKLSWKEC